MANKIKGITIKIGADTIGLDKALKDVEKKMNVIRFQSTLIEMSYEEYLKYNQL